MKPESLATAGDRREAYLDSAARAALELYARAADYLSAAQIYLQANPLLEAPLRPEHIKERLLGHWGTCPGINLVYAHLNRLIRRTEAPILLITGPGHGAPAVLAGLYLEGSLAEVYPGMTRDRAGLERLVRAFSWPDGFPSHLNPALPGVIHEGGELGYALATAFGAALDHPDLIVACIVGDGEAETGPTATAWHGTKFLNPATDGAVLPIVHLNGFKIATPTVLGTMTGDEIRDLFAGYGWEALAVDHGPALHDELAAACDTAYERIRALQRAARSGRCPERPRWPLIVLRTPKGLGGPKVVDGLPVEGSFRSHQVPAKDARTNPEHLRIVEAWLRSYRPAELFDAEGRLRPEVVSSCPEGARRMAMAPESVGGRVRRALALPSLGGRGLAVSRRGAALASSMEELGKYLRDVVAENAPARNFRVFCPDELVSNRLGAVLEVTDRQYAWPLPEAAEHTSRDGRVLEMLSEHMCQGWLQGYILTGRHGVFPCYEAFLPIVDGMINQYAKFLKSSLEVPWRPPVSSLNYILTSEAWRQEHNGYSHQGPGFLNNLLTKKGHIYRIYLPPDANSLLATVERCLEATNYVNLIVAGKQPMPQWLDEGEAREHVRVGASVWGWASVAGGEDPEIVLVGCGDNLTLEVMAAAQALRTDAPAWRVRVVNVTDLLALGIPQKYPGGLDEDRFQRLFPLGVPVVFNFHGYTAAIKQLVWERPQNERFDVNGYREEGTTTTPFAMQILNRTSRYHVAVQAAQKMARRNPGVAALAEEIVRKYERRIREHGEFIRARGVDPPEIAGWRWDDPAGPGDILGGGRTS